MIGDYPSESLFTINSTTGRISLARDIKADPEQLSSYTVLCVLVHLTCCSVSPLSQAWYLLCVCACVCLWVSECVRESVIVWVCEWVSECMKECVCVYEWVSVWEREWLCGCVSEWVSAWKSVCVCMCACLCVCVWMSECERENDCVCACVCACVRVCVRASVCEWWNQNHTLCFAHVSEFILRNWSKCW